ncbi:MAG: hypothetical protein QM495_03740 [Lutibacter sp.]|uniref:hypothetical protein n=1 Tax=Lutibacter sp. TaxID=1925666 RepID=UPI00385909D3
MKPKIHNLSLNGVTGILFGIISTILIVLINILINQFTSSNGITSVLPISFLEITLLICGIFFVFISYLVIVFVNKRRRKKSNFKGWELNAKKIRLIFFIQFIVVICISYLCIQIGMLKLIVPILLLIYGISCILVNPFTNGYSTILGLFFALQSLLAMFFSEIQFLLLAIAFGGFHIIYGIVSSKKQF